MIVGILYVGVAIWLYTHYWLDRTERLVGGTLCLVVALAHFLS